MKLFIKNQKLSVRRNQLKTAGYMAIAALFSILVSCYGSYTKDYDYTAVYFGTQKPLRTLVARNDSDYLEFKIGVALGGLRESTKDYSAQFTVDPTLLNTVDSASQFTLLPENLYIIDNPDNTFIIPKGKMLGDCPVKINKTGFTDLPGSLNKTYALPLRLVSTSADSILSGMDYTIIVIKYISEYSGSYFCRGWEAQWNGSDTTATTSYFYNDLSACKVRQLSTLSLTQFEMIGMGSLDNPGKPQMSAADHLQIGLVDGVVTLSTISGKNPVTDRGSSYNASTKTFTLNYIYTKGSINYLVNEELVLRQDVEADLRFETW